MTIKEKIKILEKEIESNTNFISALKNKKELTEENKLMIEKVKAETRAIQYCLWILNDNSFAKKIAEAYYL